jgi:hypothetical protein
MRIPDLAFGTGTRDAPPRGRRPPRPSLAHLAYREFTESAPFSLLHSLLRFLIHAHTLSSPTRSAQSTAQTRSDGSHPRACARASQTRACSGLPRHRACRRPGCRRSTRCLHPLLPSAPRAARSLALVVSLSPLPSFILEGFDPVSGYIRIHPKLTPKAHPNELKTKLLTLQICHIARLTHHIPIPTRVAPHRIEGSPNSRSSFESLPTGHGPSPLSQRHRSDAGCSHRTHL